MESNYTFRPNSKVQQQTLSSISSKGFQSIHNVVQTYPTENYDHLNEPRPTTPMEASKITTTSKSLNTEHINF